MSKLKSNEKLDEFEHRMSIIENKIGILGGSFNPAHQGHIHISLLAIKKLKLQ